MILNLAPSGSMLDCDFDFCHVQSSAHPLPHLMPVTVVARAVAEPTFRNLRFIDIGGRALVS